jgi:branched-chain amino acid transport system permease protein
MKGKFFIKTEWVAALLGTALALIMGGWSLMLFAVIAGAFVGFTSETTKAGARRAAIAGFVATLITVLGGWVHNNIIVTLPGLEPPPAASNTLPVYAAALGLGTLAAVALAWTRASENDRIRRYGPLALIGLAAVIFPFFNQSTGLDIVWTSAMVVALIYCMQALGLNIVAGYSGMLDLGYVAFFAIGGYTAAFLNSPQFDLAVPFWIIVFIAGFAAALFGLILGAPVIPLRGDYLAIVTLGFGEIVPIVFRNLEAVRIYEPISEIVTALQGRPQDALCLVGCGDLPLNITNGVQGINPIGRPDVLGYVFETGKYIPWYFLILIMVAVAAFFINHLRRSRMGRAWVGMREDELAASAMGVPVVRTKLLAFMIGAMFSGFAGAFYASYVSFISPDAFDFSISVIVLSMVILGGSGSIPGVILGAMLIKLIDPLLLDELQRVVGGILQVTLLRWIDAPGFENFIKSLLDPTQYKLMLFGLILVIMMRVRPQGLIPAGIVKYKG